MDSFQREKLPADRQPVVFFNKFRDIQSVQNNHFDHSVRPKSATTDNHIKLLGRHLEESPRNQQDVCHKRQVFQGVLCYEH